MQSCIKAIPEILERTLRVAGAKYLSTGSALLKVINNTRGVSELRIRIRIRGYPHEF